MSYSNQMIVHAVDTMESYLNNKLPETKLWEHSFIKKQIDRREYQENFTIDNGILKQIYTKTGNEYNTMINNLKNPMFPKDRVGQLLADMISKYPFAQAEYELLINVYGENDETREIINYFNFSMD